MKAHIRTSSFGAPLSMTTKVKYLLTACYTHQTLALLPRMHCFMTTSQLQLLLHDLIFATEVEQSSSVSLLRLFCSKVVFLCFHPFLVSVLFSGPSLLALNFYRKILTPSLCSFYWLLGSKLINSYGCTSSGNLNNIIDDLLKLQRVAQLASFVLIKRCIVGSKAAVWCVVHVCSHKVREFCCQAQLRTKQRCIQTCSIRMHNVVSQNDQCMSRTVALQLDLQCNSKPHKQCLR